MLLLAGATLVVVTLPNDVTGSLVLHHPWWLGSVLGMVRIPDPLPPHCVANLQADFVMRAIEPVSNHDLGIWEF